MAYKHTLNLRLQTTAIGSETSKLMQQPVKKATPKPLFWDPAMEGSDEQS
jgi:hypothetical protein